MQTRHLQVLFMTLHLQRKKILPVSIGALLKGAQLALANPVNSYNLVKLASSSDIYLDSNFQKSILEKS